MEEQLKTLEQKMIEHDWFYNYNDNYSEWARSHAHYGDILRLAKSLQEEGYADEVEALFDKHSPESY
jgi:hypothetical protein